MYLYSRQIINFQEAIKSIQRDKRLNAKFEYNEVKNNILVKFFRNNFIYVIQQAEYLVTAGAICDAIKVLLIISVLIICCKFSE